MSPLVGGLALGWLGELIGEACALIHLPGTYGATHAAKEAMSEHTPARRGDLPSGYPQVLEAAKAAVQAARTRAALAANAELIRLYWTLGRLILDRQDVEGWGTKVIDRLSKDLRIEFPEMKGFSPSNLKYMRMMAAAWPDREIGLRLVDQLPWGHIQDLLNKLDDQELRDWYAREAIANGWTRAVLVNQIKSQLHARAGAAPSNFARALPAGQSELVAQIVKDPYNFEFLTLAADASERDVEDGLVADLARTLQELGLGFYYAGRQHRLTITDDEGEDHDYYLDLLFYHHYLRRFVVFELKIDTFRPEYAGKLNFYCNVVDDQLRHHDGSDEPTIGILLCASRSKTVVDYALRGVDTPVAVAEYTYSQLPQELQDALPSPADLEQLAAEALEEADPARAESE
ncbi:MAG: PDDEXK nuclease domain-containing protein [Microthrixaceae bacterium]